MMLFTVLLVVALSAVGPAIAQVSDFSLPSTYTVWDNDNWILSTNKLIQAQYQSRLNLANGYLGCSQAAAGPFFEADQNLTNPGGSQPINGWPLDDPRQTFCSVVGFWDEQVNTTGSNFPWLLQYGGESVISGVPHWGAIIFEFGGSQLDATVDNTTISNFESSLSVQNGVATWSYTWAPAAANGTQFNVTYTAIASRSRPNVAAVQADIVSSSDFNGTVTDLLDGRTAVRSVAVGKGMDQNQTSIYSAVSPNGISNVTAYIVSLANFTASSVSQGSRTMANQSWIPSNQSTIGQTFNVTLKAGQMTSLIKFIGGASSDAFSDPQDAARNAASSAQATGWDALMAEHEAAWATIFPHSSVDDYSYPNGSLPNDPNIQEMQVSSVVSPFYLLQNSLGGNLGPGLNNNSIAVSGVSSDSYAGMIFWDADTFMSPGLLLAHPEYARIIANYRISKAGQANANAMANNFSSDALLYPWTSSRFGNCTGTGMPTLVDSKVHSIATNSSCRALHRL